MDSNVKIALLQDKPGLGIRDDYHSILEQYDPDILALPEYYFVNSDEKNVIHSASRHDSILDGIKSLSIKYKCLLIGGTVVVEQEDKLFNRTYLFDNGIMLGHYDKIHPYDNEGKGRIQPGYEYKVFNFNGIRIGILICADILYPDSFKNIRGLQPDLIFVPTTSPYRENEPTEEKFARDNEIFAKGAMASNSIIFKIGASGKITRHVLQGRSLIAFPDEIIWRIDPDKEDRSALVLANCGFDPENPWLEIKVMHL